MAYDSVTKEGSKVNAGAYKRYQDWVTEQQSNGLPTGSYDDWMQMNTQSQDMSKMDTVKKYY